MTRTEKIALLNAALNGKTDGLRDLQRQREVVSGIVICEQPDFTADSRVCWWRADGTRVVEEPAEFDRREKAPGLMFLPHNGREPFFEIG